MSSRTIKFIKTTKGSKKVAKTYSRYKTNKHYMYRYTHCSQNEKEKKKKKQKNYVPGFPSSL